MSDSLWPHELQPSRLLHPWDLPGKSTGVGCHCLLHTYALENENLYSHKSLYTKVYSVSIQDVARGHQRADTLKPYSQKISQFDHTRTTALFNSMKLSHAHGTTQDGRVMVERSDRMLSIGEGNGKPLQYSCLENLMKSMKAQNNRILNEELPRSVGAQ